MIPSCCDGKNKRYQTSQTVHGLTEEYCRYLDSIASVDISYAATWKERSRYENNLALGSYDGSLPGPTTRRHDFPLAVRTLAAIKHEQGRVSKMYRRLHCREHE